MKRVFLFLILGMMLTGCVRIPRDSVEIHRYSIDADSIALINYTGFNYSILIPAFSADAMQKGERILYRERDRQMEYYFYHRWIVAPEKMIGDLLANRLEESGVFRGGVFRSHVGVIPTHELRGRLLTLYADNSTDPELTRFEVRLTLYEINSQNLEKTIVFQKNYPYEITRESDRVGYHVDAVSRAVTFWINEATDDIIEVLDSHSQGNTPPLRPEPVPVSETSGSAENQQ